MRKWDKAPRALPAASFPLRPPLHSAISNLRQTALPFPRMPPPRQLPPSAPSPIRYDPPFPWPPHLATHVPFAHPSTFLLPPWPCLRFHLLAPLPAAVLPTFPYSSLPPRLYQYQRGLSQWTQPPVSPGLQTPSHTRWQNPPIPPNCKIPRPQSPNHHFICRFACIPTPRRSSTAFQHSVPTPSTVHTPEKMLRRSSPWQLPPAPSCPTSSAAFTNPTPQP